MIVIDHENTEALRCRFHRGSRININVGHFVIGKHLQSSHVVQVAAMAIGLSLYLRCKWSASAPKAHINARDNVNRWPARLPSTTKRHLSPSFAPVMRRHMSRLCAHTADDYWRWRGEL